jgi:hypothetical protein
MSVFTPCCDIESLSASGVQMFIGRRKELAVLEQAYRSPQSALIPIYG